MKKLLTAVVVFTLGGAFFQVGFGQENPENISEINPSETAEEQAIRLQEAELAGRKWLSEAEQAYDKKRYSEAIINYQRALSTLPRTTALERLRIIAQRGLSDAYARQAQLYLRADDLENAEKSVNEALRANPSGRLARSTSQKIRAAREEFTEAQTDYVYTPEYVAKQERITDLIHQSYLLLHAREYDKAEEQAKEALRLDPYDLDAQDALMEIRSRRGNVASFEIDAVRNKYLNQINETWDHERRAPVPRPYESKDSSLGAVREKLRSIIIPNVDFPNIDIREAVNEFIIPQSIENDPEKEGINIVFDSGVFAGLAIPTEPAPGFEGAAPPGGAVSGVPKIDLRLRNMSLGKVLEFALKQAGLTYEIVDDVVVILREGTQTQADFVQKDYEVDPSIFHNAIEQTAEAGGGDVGEISVAKIYGIEKEGGSYGEDPTARAIQFNAGFLKTFFEAMGVQFPPESRIFYHQKSGKLVMYNTNQNHTRLDFALRIVSIPPRQIEIEARFVDISMTKAKALGFNWAFQGIGSPSNAITLFDGNKFKLDVTETLSYAAGLQTGTAAFSGHDLGLSGIIDNIAFGALITALDNQSGVDLLSAPRVTVQSGQIANTQLLIKTEYVSDTEYNLTRENGSTFVETTITKTEIEFGAVLSALPVVSADGYTINLALAPAILTDEGTRQLGEVPLGLGATGVPIFAPITAPQLGVRTVETSVTIWDRQTVVLGGLISESVIHYEDRIPGLSNVPVIGRLFRSKGETRDKRNTMIFTSVKLIDAAGRPYLKPQQEKILIPAK